MISRFIENKILKKLASGRVVGLFGARRTGKTVLLEKIKKNLKGKKILSVHGGNLDVSEILSSQRVGVLSKFVNGFDYLFIDEAQTIPKIGENLKLLTDTVPNLSIFVTGSASFDLRSKIGEPLTGRSVFLHLYPISQLEFKEQESVLETKEHLEERLIYGSYPQVVMSKTLAEKKEQLEGIRDGYLLKDILELDNLKDSLFIINLLRQIAFQVGQDVSYFELASNLNTQPKTVRRYLELLQKTFVLFSLPGFSRNLRKEYTKTPRYYFWDLGIRSAVISNFNGLQLRDDVGRLWENYCISERIKRNEYKNVSFNGYYWRTYDQKEIDFVEERGGKLFGYEMKWKKDKVKKPKDFLENYKGSKYEIINKDNYLEFVV